MLFYSNNQIEKKKQKENSFCFFFYNNSQTKIGARIDPITALSVMETELIDAVSSPYSIAFEVPITCEPLPKDIPCPIGPSILNHLKIIGPKSIPVKPAIRTKMTVRAGIPPISAVICMATGVVIDFETMERIEA